MKRITINTALQQYRDRYPLQVIKDEVVTIIEDVQVQDDDFNVDFLLTLIRQLPDRYRLVFNLYVLDDYSHKEIAELLQISEGTSKSNLSRARQLLKKQIDAYKHMQKEA